MISASIVAVQTLIVKTVFGIVMIAIKSGKKSIMGIFNKKEVISNEIPDRVIIYKGELEYLSRCILDYPNIETGGNLFGFYTTFRIPIIQYVLGPGEKSVRSTTHFRQDEIYFNTNADKLINDHALHHIGTWHSHHQLAINHPSGGDANSKFYGMKEDGLDSFLLVIGNYYDRKTSANAYYFSLTNKNYKHCKWVILDGESPIRFQYDKKNKNYINVPRTSNPMMHQIQSFPLYGEPGNKISYSKGYWLNDESNNAEIKIIVDSLSNKYKHVSFFLQEEDRTLKTIIKDNNISIIFPFTFPIAPPEIFHNNKKLGDFGWEKNGSISKRFIDYCKKGEIL